MFLGTWSCSPGTGQGLLPVPSTTSPSIHQSSIGLAWLVMLLLDCEGDEQPLAAALQNVPMHLHGAALPLCSHRRGDVLPAAYVTSCPPAPCQARCSSWQMTLPWWQEAPHRDGLPLSHWSWFYPWLSRASAGKIWSRVFAWVDLQREAGN